MRKASAKWDMRGSYLRRIALEEDFALNTFPAAFAQSIWT
jgi:hypothetical protein